MKACEKGGARSPWWALFRVSNLPTVWTNVGAALVLSGGGFDLRSLVVALVALSGLYCAGMALNDLWDVESDRARRPDRPIPAGRVSQTHVSLVVVALFAGSLALLALAPYPRAVWPGGVLVVAIGVYNRWHKRAAWTVAVMGLCRGLVYVTAGVAAVGGVTPVVGAAAVAQTAYVTGFTVAARNRRPGRAGRRIPVPWLLAGISLVDGVAAATSGSGWLGLGMAGFFGTLWAQRWVSGD